MHRTEEKLRAPEFRATHWLNVPKPLSLRQDLAGKTVLVDFWDYTCINCLHTLPYLKGWHERYAQYGLVIVGVHAPEFAFAKDVSLVEKAVRDLGITYPVAIDNGYQTWEAYANRFWPAKYLIDGAGYLRGLHTGEGRYTETERLIQQVLLEQQPGLDFPDPLPVLLDMDQPGAVCHPVTPELYLGTRRGQLGKPQQYEPGKIGRYELPDRYEPETLYLGGMWKAEDEYAEHAGARRGAIALFYKAKEVNLVMAPGENPAEVYVSQDGDWLPEADWGADVTKSPDGRPVVHVAQPRMHRLVNNRHYGMNELMLVTESPGLRAYAFTFVSCVSESPATAG